LELAKSAPEETLKVLALRGYVRLGGELKDRKQKVERFRTALAASPRAEEKKLVLGEIGGVDDPEALKLAAMSLTDEGVKEEAATAIVKIARGISMTNRLDAQEALENVRQRFGSGEIYKQAGEALDFISKYEDYITAWQVTGPFKDEKKDDKELLDTLFPPEIPGAKDVNWWMLGAGEDEEKPWLLDLNHALWWSNHCVGYLRTRVWSPKKQKVAAEAGSDDGIKIWLNGAVVHDNNAWRGVKPGDDKFEVLLNKGWNNVMLKVSNGGGDWGACIRFRTKDGEAIPELKAEAPGE
jgi:hypothetical protein